MASAIDWDEGLPLDVLALVAGGALKLSKMKAMRGVSKTWQRGYEIRLTKLTIRKAGPIPNSMEQLAERFPALTSLDLGKSLLPPIRLARLASLKNLVILNLGERCPEEYGVYRWREPETGQLAGDLNTLEPLQGIPLQSLSLYGCKCLLGSALAPLNGMPLATLDLSLCSGLSPSSWGKLSVTEVPKTG